MSTIENSNLGLSNKFTQVEDKANRSKNIQAFEMLCRTILHPVTSIFIVSLLIASAVALYSTASVEEIITSWGTGLKSNFAYAMQFMLLLLLSYTLAMTPIFQKLLQAISSLFKTERSAIISLVLFSCVLSWFNWALGVVGGIFLARNIALAHQEKGKTINFPLLAAAGMAGLVVSESGLSGNVMLFMTQPSKMFSAFPAISLSTSAFSTLNIVANLLVIAAIAAVLLMFADKNDSAVNAASNAEAEKFPESKEQQSFAVKMENSQLVSLVFGGIGLFYILLHFSNGGSMNFKTYLLLLIVLGIVLRKGPLSYQADVTASSSYAWIFFFPIVFAGAIQGMLDMDATRDFLSQTLISMNTDSTFSALNMVYATVGNFFIPNAGAQWLIEGQSILTAGQHFNLSPEASMLSFCYGTGVAKLLNGFILIPVLGLAGIKFTAVFKYIFAMAAASAVAYIVVISIFI